MIVLYHLNVFDNSRARSLIRIKCSRSFESVESMDEWIEGFKTPVRRRYHRNNISIYPSYKEVL